MAIAGDLNRWSNQFPDSLVPRVLRLILESWDKFRTTQRYEVPITREFLLLLERNHELSRLPFLIDREILLTEEGGQGELARIDLRFTHGYRHEVYFSLECKRLRVQSSQGRDSLAGKYVKDGMFRYFNGKYAQGLNKGGMVGYVMDGDVAKAIDDVRQAIESQREVLCMGPGDALCECSLLSSTRVRESSHRYGDQRRFMLYHLFMPMPLN